MTSSICDVNVSANSYIRIVRLAHRSDDYHLVKLLMSLAGGNIFDNTVQAHQPRPAMELRRARQQPRERG